MNLSALEIKNITTALAMIVFNDANLDDALPKQEKSLTIFVGQFCMAVSLYLYNVALLKI